jgi:hypothetical protein
MAPLPTETWAIMASRHGQKRFVQQNKRRINTTVEIPLVGSILYEDDDLKGQILASKAMAIVQQSLSSGSVLFSFQKTLFADRVEAYKLIQEQISSKVEFRPLSLYDVRDDGSLLIEAKFTDTDHAKQAMMDGVKVQGVMYKASSSRESAEFGDIKHVQLTLLRMTEKETFLHDVMESLSYFGRVLQVKQFTRNGYFEGKISVILDTSVGYQVGESEWQEARPLDRMVYLSEFDCYASATYKGAPPVCHFCGHSGHVRAKCPELAKRKCFGCNKHGHMIRFCPEGKQENYLKKQKVSHDTGSNTNKEVEEKTQAREASMKVSDFIDLEKLGEGKAEIDESGKKAEDVMIDSEDEHVDDVSDTEHSDLNCTEYEEQMEMEKERYDDGEQDIVMLPGGNLSEKVGDVGGYTSRGSAHSKYASESVAVAMKVDTPAEMLKLSTLQSRTQRKLDAFDSKLKQGSAGNKGSIGGKISGLSNIKTAGADASASTKTSKIDKNAIKRTSSTKDIARRAQ